MILIILSWVYVFIISFLWGIASSALIRKYYPFPEIRNIPLLSLLGLLFITVISGLMSIVINIGITAHAIIAIGALCFAVVERKQIRSIFSPALNKFYFSDIFIAFIFLTSVIITAYFSYQPSANYDDGLYYTQAIRWTESYRAVPGLGNLHARLAFNSSWHWLSALFSFSFLDVYLNDLNGYLFVISLLFSLLGLRQLFVNNITLTNCIKAFYLLPIIVIIDPQFFNLSNSFFLSAPAADFAGALVAWLVFILYIEKTEKGNSELFDGYTILIVLFSCWAVTVKLSLIPVLILPLIIFSQTVVGRNFKNIFFLVGVSLLAFAPWIIRNYILSGYFIFPLHQTGFLNPDWKVPQEIPDYYSQIVTSWAKGFEVDLNKNNDWSISSWVPAWYNNLTINNKVLLCFCILFLFSYFIFYAYCLIRKQFIFLYGLREYIYVILTLIAGMLFWFLKAPDFRFGYGFTLFFFIFTLAVLTKVLVRDYCRIIAWLIVCFFIYTNTVVYHNSYRIYVKTEELLFKALPPMPVSSVQEKPLNNNLKIFKTLVTDQCWDDPIPCAPFNEAQNIEARGESLQIGFRSTQK